MVDVRHPRAPAPPYERRLPDSNAPLKDKRPPAELRTPGCVRSRTRPVGQIPEAVGLNLLGYALPPQHKDGGLLVDEFSPDANDY